MMLPGYSRWRHSATPIVMESFTGPAKGPAVPLSSSVLETFQLFFSVALVREIVEQTNRYASHVIEGGNSKWTDVTESDIWAFLGFMILMGINRLPGLRHYWNTSPIFRYAPVADRITRDRFTEIMRYIHFVDNTTLVTDRTNPNYDRLGKIRPVIEQIQQACLKCYHGSQNQSIDEAMIAFKGRSAMKQYMPKKPTKRGFKVWVRADSKNGYVCQMDFYTGKQGDRVEVGLGANIVRRLSESLVGQHYSLYMDNYFSSISLFKTLLELGIYATGTLRSNRKLFPTDLVPLVKKGLPSRGNFVFRQHGNISVIVWQDTKPVVIISSQHSPSTTGTVQRKKKSGERIDVVSIIYYENPTANTSVVVVSTRHRTTFYSTTSFMHQHEHNCHY